jgi:hypothetical protein
VVAVSRRILPKANRWMKPRSACGCSGRNHRVYRLRLVTPKEAFCQRLIKNRVR